MQELSPPNKIETCEQDRRPAELTLARDIEELTQITISVCMESPSFLKCSSSMLPTWHHSEVSQPLDNVLCGMVYCFLAPNPTGFEVNYGARFQKLWFSGYRWAEAILVSTLPARRQRHTFLGSYKGGRKLQ